MELIKYTIPDVPEIEYFTDKLNLYINIDEIIKCHKSDDFTEVFYILHNYGSKSDGTIDYENLISRYEWRIPKGAWNIRQFHNRKYHAIFKMEGPWVELQIEVGYTYQKPTGELTFYSDPLLIKVDNRYQTISSPFINSITSNYLTSEFFDYSRKFFDVVVGDFQNIPVDIDTIVIDKRGLFPKKIQKIENNKITYDVVSSDMQMLLRYILRDEEFKNMIAIQLNKEPTDNINTYEELLFMLEYNYRKIPLHIRGDLTLFWGGN